MYFDALAKRYHFKLTDPIKELPKEAIDAILYGTKGEALQLRYEKNEGFGVIKREFEGIVNNLERRYRETQSPAMRADIEECMSEVNCPECNGRRLKKTALAVSPSRSPRANISRRPSMPARLHVTSTRI